MAGKPLSARAITKYVLSARPFTTGGASPSPKLGNECLNLPLGNRVFLVRTAPQTVNGISQVLQILYQLSLTMDLMLSTLKNLSQCHAEQEDITHMLQEHCFCRGGSCAVVLGLRRHHF